MTRLVCSTTINAPLDAVEAIVIDGENSPEWVAGCVEAETGEGYPEPGSKLHGVQKMGPLKIRQTMTIAGLERGRSFTEQMEGMLRGTLRWEYAPQGEATQVTVSADYQMAGGVLGQALDGLMMKGNLTSTLEQSLKNLKALAEGSAP